MAKRANIPMNVFSNINVLMVQRCKRCTFDSPGLTSESEVYPGLFAVSDNNAVGVVPFIY
ncbi:lipopolysaccharide modification acyltransferase [Segatella salivae]|uniref:lipopolysaccharide modification acyltransferase n=1 Tax=Segatella salivae TaxID=228604 RepID=UPI00248D9C24|nr:lipopolysaccharide modification acyltransferase [Segatella salivae]